MKQNLQLVGTTRIFAKEMDGKTVYSTSISNRNLDGTYEKMYITVQFPKGTVIENQTDITILESFMSFYKNKDRRLTNLKRKDSRNLKESLD